MDSLIFITFSAGYLSHIVSKRNVFQCQKPHGKNAEPNLKFRPYDCVSIFMGIKKKEKKKITQSIKLNNFTYDSHGKAERRGSRLVPDSPLSRPRL